MILRLFNPARMTWQGIGYGVLRQFGNSSEVAVYSRKFQRVFNKQAVSIRFEAMRYVG